MLENKEDEKIKDLTENDYPIKAINVDFSDLNNMNMVIRTSFKRAEKYLDSHVDERDNWFYIAELNNEGVRIIGLVRMTLTAENGYLRITHLEKNRVINDENIEKRIIDYFKGYSKFKHLKGIYLSYDKTDGNSEEIIKSVRIYEDNGFNRKEGSLIFEWENK